GAGRDVPVHAGEVDLPVVPAHAVQLAALSEVEDFLPWSLFRFALEVRQEVVAVGVNLPGLAVGLVPVLQLLDDVRHTGPRAARGHPVLLGEDLVDLRARLDQTGPS